MISMVNKCSVSRGANARSDDIAHLTGVLTEAVVRPTPFPYALIENFLPEDLFTTLRQEVKEAKGPLWLGGTDRSSSFLIQAIEEPDGLTNAGRRAVAALSSRPVVEAARRLFDVQHEPPVAGLTVGVELMRDGAGFMLPPHTDNSVRIIGALVYLADPGDPPTMGTRLYTPKDPDLRSNGNASLWWDAVDEAAAAPYRPNLALLWVRSDISLHGVPYNVVDRDRRALQWCIERVGS